MHMIVSYVAPNKKLILNGGLGPLNEMGLTGTLVWSFSPTTPTPDDQPQSSNITLSYTVNGMIRDIAPETLAAAVDNVQRQQLEALAAFSTRIDNQ